MARETVSKSNQKKTYTDAADVITVTGSSNKIYTIGGNDVIKLNKGKNNLIDGGAGNDTITVSGGNKHKLRGGVGSDSYIINSAIAKSTIFTINQTDYKKKDADTLKLSKVSKNDVTYGLLNGTMTIKHRSGGKIAVSGWGKNKLSKIAFKDGTLTASQYKNNIYNVKALNNAKGKTLTYKDGLKAHEEFAVNFSTNTNIVINSASATADRITFSNKGGWSTDHENLYVKGNDLILGNWDSKNAKELAGQITIKNFMTSSVKTIEFSNQTYHLLTKTGTYTGSDTFSDRFMILDGVKNGSNASAGDWNITLKGVKANDLIDLRALPNNSRYYSLNGTADGKDMVLTHSYAVKPSESATLGTLRLKNFFKADGTVNTANGYPLIRINREFYAGRFADNTFDGPVWDRVRAANGAPEKNYRRAFLNAGTAKADTVDLGKLKKPNSNYVWLYYAGAGNDTITAQAGDIVYGGNGNDELTAAGRMTDIRGGAGDDTIYVRGKDDSNPNLDRVVVQGNSGNDKIYGNGSYLFLSGSSGNDEIHIYSKGAVTKNSFAGGGYGEDVITIHAGYSHRINGGNDNDKLYAYLGDKHILNGGSGDDEIHIIDDGTQRSQGNIANGGNGDDTLYIENGGHAHALYGNAGNDTLSADGSENSLFGDSGSDVLTSLNGDTNYLSGGDDDDILTVKGGKESSLWGDAGNDTIIVDGGNNIQMHGGAGSDTYIINSGFTAANGLHIYQNTDYGFNDGDADVLELTGINMGDVRYEFQENVLWIHSLSDSDVGAIAVNGWDENPLSSIKFADGSMTTEAVNALRA